NLTELEKICKEEWEKIAKSRCAKLIQTPKMIQSCNHRQRCSYKVFTLVFTVCHYPKSLTFFYLSLFNTVTQHLITNVQSLSYISVPPAVPECSLSGKPVLKGNVTLSCKSKSGKPIPMYKWQKTSPTSEVFFSPMLNEKTGTLKLSNLSSNMSGKYVCSASNTAGTKRCYINLEVITSNNAGMIAGATVGSVLGLIFIILFLVGLLRRRRDSEEDLANDIKEDAQAPKRISWAKSSDVVSKNGTLSSITTANRPHQREPSSHYNTDTTLPPPPAPRLPPLPTVVTASNISRMGGVPIMVPAQNQAGSLV
uniref:Endothelial cell adhesion molecule a n=1 Tax=Hucho hucho TaxID=62062 RepID=A0A4W5NLZ2_9TELE